MSFLVGNVIGECCSRRGFYTFLSITIHSLYLSQRRNANSIPFHSTYPFIDPFRFQDSLKGKVVLITHAHRGIGRATALAFVQAGASVCCTGSSAQALQPVLRLIKEKFDTPTLALTVDLLSPTEPKQLIKLVEKYRGPVDILINVTPPSYAGPFTEEVDIMKDWWPSLENNLRAPIALIHEVLPSMIARGSGIIIISTTTATGLHEFPLLFSESVAMAALLKFHSNLTIEIKDKGILNYAVNPGPCPSHIHDPDNQVQMIPSHLGALPELQAHLVGVASTVEWTAAGLAAGTFLMLCAEPRATLLSGLYVNAERDIGELLTEMETLMGRRRVEREKLYQLKVDEL